MGEFDIRSYGVSMTNLEDVFLKINQEFAPDLFGDLKGRGFEDSKNISLLSDGSKNADLNDPAYVAKSIGHSTIDKTKDKDKDSNGSNDGDVSQDSSMDASKDFEVDPDDATNLIRGSSCVRSCTASSAKRFIIYKRDWCGLIC